MRVFLRKLRYYMHYYEIYRFFRNWGKKWGPTNTTVGAYISTIVQPYPIFRKLLAIIPSIQNHPHLRILTQKMNTNTKSPMLLTQLVLWYQINCNTNAVIVILSHKKIVKSHMVLWLATILVLGMYVLLNQVAFFTSSK